MPNSRRKAVNNWLLVWAGVLVLIPAPVHAQETDEASGVRIDSGGEVVLYTSAMLAAGVCAVANGAGIAWKQTTSPGWRWAGVGFGLVELGVGTYLALNEPRGTRDLGFAIAPFVIGVGALATAAFVPASESTGQWRQIGVAPTRGGGWQLQWLGRF